MTAAGVFLLLALGNETPLGPTLPARHAEAVFRRMMATEPFVGSDEHRQARRGAGRFFSAEEYARLHGNPVIGYWDVDGFSWLGRRLAFRGIRSMHPSAQRIGAQAWRAAVGRVAARQGLDLSPKASLSIEGGCVGAVIDASVEEPVPGVLVEVRLRSPAGTLLYRVGVGKATVEDAMGAAIDLILTFARSLESTGGQHAR